MKCEDCKAYVSQIDIEDDFCLLGSNIENGYCSRSKKIVEKKLVEVHKELEIERDESIKIWDELEKSGTIAKWYE